MRADAHAAYLVELTAAALHHKELPIPECEIDGSYLVRLISAHHLSGLLYPLFQKNSGVLDEQSLELLKRDYRTDQLRDATQEDALEEILDAFSARGVRVMLLKGIIHKRFYEKSYHRMMGDLDLLIDHEHRATAREIMESLGYETQLFDELYDDVYYRRPFLNVEIHVELGEEAEFYDARFHSLWERSVASEYGELVREMSLEDYYLYFVLHAQKHCMGHGTGIRTLIDFWYAKRRLLELLEESQRTHLMEEYGCAVFEREFYHLASVWFDGEAGDAFFGEPMRRFLVLNSGLYGNEMNTLYRHAIKSGDLHESHANKRGMFLKRIFLPLENMKIKYPVLEKHPYLLVFCWIHRILKTVFSRGKVREEAKLYSDISEGMAFQSELRSRFGFTQSYGSAQDGAE